MTDSPQDLTESVIALGKTLEGRGQLCAPVFCCSHCDNYEWVARSVTTLVRLQQIDPTDLRADQIRRFKASLQNKQDHFTARLNRFAQVTKKNRYKLGAREFTLTYSPKWFDDAEARVEMKKAIGKLIKYYKDKIIHLRAVGEVGTNGLSHIHCFYKLEGGVKITDKNFKRAWPHWDPSKPHGKGFQGGHHADVKEESDFLGYIDKDIEGAWLEENIQP